MVQAKLSFRLAGAALLAALAACQTQQRVPQEIADRIEYVETEAMLGKKSVDSAANALQQLRDANDAQLPGAYASLVTALDRLESKAGGVGIIFNTAEVGARRYFGKWEKQISEIKDDDLRNRAMDRRAEMLGAYADVQAKFDAARTSFRPYFSNLQDIEKTMAKDQTQAGKSAAMPTIQQALDQHKIVDRDLDAVVDSLESLRMK